MKARSDHNQASNKAFRARTFNGAHWMVSINASSIHQQVLPSIESEPNRTCSNKLYDLAACRVYNWQEFFVSLDRLSEIRWSVLKLMDIARVLKARRTTEGWFVSRLSSGGAYLAPPLEHLINAKETGSSQNWKFPNRRWAHWRIYSHHSQPLPNSLENGENGSVAQLWLFSFASGALELEGVEVQIQLGDKKNIEDLIPKKVWIKKESYTWQWAKRSWQG